MNGKNQFYASCISKKLEKLYRDLRAKYGSPENEWKLWCKRKKTKAEREEIIIGSILTQRASWKNVELAINNLKNAKICSLYNLCRFGKQNRKRLMEMLKPSGFYHRKIEYLLSLANFIVKSGGIKVLKNENPKSLREKLLKLKGVGKETADTILLYGFDKPVFIIDEYTRRFVKKHQLSRDSSYEFLKKLFETNMRRDADFYQDFHALIVIDGKNGRKGSVSF